MAFETAYLGGKITDYPHTGNHINGYIWLHRVDWPTYQGINVSVFNGIPTKNVTVEPGLYTIEYCFGENTEAFQVNLIAGINDVSTLYPQEEIKLPILKGEKGERGEKGDKGDAGQPNVLTIGTVTITEPSIPPSAAIRGNSPNQKLDLNLPSANELYGTGKPSGVITANPGTYYTDVAGTNGAWRWIKTNGTGNTGWIVVFGDTGERNISAAGVGGCNSTSSRITRAGALVIAQIQIGIPAGWVSGSVGLVIPEGYRSATQIYLPAGHNGSMAPPVIMRATGEMELYATAATTARWLWTWHTKEEWPSTLPGIPA